jgi:hypothetical protein
MIFKSISFKFPCDFHPEISSLFSKRKTWRGEAIKIIKKKGTVGHLPNSHLQLIKATVLPEISLYLCLSTPVMPADMRQVGVALFPSF